MTTTLDRKRSLLSALALLAPFVAFALAWPLWELIQPNVWVLFYPAVFISCMLGGRRIGLIATAISALFVWWLLPPARSFVGDPHSVLAVGVFCATGVALAFFQDRLSKVRTALAEARAFLENVLESSTEYSIIAKDLQRRILAWNSGAARNYGYEASEVIGKSSDMLHVPEELRSGMVADLHQRALVDGHASGLFWRRRKDGSEFLARVTITRRNDARGNAIGFLIVSHDVTAEQRHIREQQFLAEVGETLQGSLNYAETVERIVQLVTGFMGDACAVDVVDDDGSLVRMRVVYSANEPLAKALELIVPGPDHPAWTVLETHRPLLVTEVTHDFLRAIARNEKHLRLLEELAPQSTMLVPLSARGRIIAVLSIVSCRADRRYTEADLHLAEELARRASLALDNARLYEVAQRAIHTRDQVLGIVAHDLRNPLGTILMQASLLRQGIGEQGQSSTVSAERIERGAARMNRIIQDLLDVTRMETGGLTIEPARVPSRQVISESVEAQKQLAASASLELGLDVTDDLPDIWADHDRLLQVFENLIGNAVKFTEPGGQIIVGGSSRGREVLFWVRDTGSGIAAEDLPFVFERHWQARLVGGRGAGLGLLIVKGIVEGHGGRIWVESTAGVGSTFFFTIPTAAAAEERAA
jgi:PAS domain S-box-containing protein